MGALTFTLKYTAATNGSIQGPADQVVIDGNSGAPVFAQPTAGFKFVKWSDDKTINPRIDTNVKANLTLSATFAAV
ncbi:hypothetical protein D3C71_2045630 [compost metagenome]